MQPSTRNGIIVISAVIGFVLLLCIPFFVICIRDFLRRHQQRTIRGQDIDLEQRKEQDPATDAPGSRASSPSLMSPGEAQRCHQWIAKMTGTDLLKGHSRREADAAPLTVNSLSRAEPAQEIHELEGSSVDILPAATYQPKRTVGRRDIEGILWLPDGTPYFLGFDGDHTRLHKEAKSRRSPRRTPPVYPISTNF